MYNISKQIDGIALIGFFLPYNWKSLRHVISTILVMVFVMLPFDSLYFKSYFISLLLSTDN